MTRAELHLQTLLIEEHTLQLRAALQTDSSEALAQAHRLQHLVRQLYDDISLRDPRHEPDPPRHREPT